MRRILVILAMIAPGTPAVAADRPEPPQRGEVIEDAASSLAIRVDRGAVTGLQRIADVHPTDYIAAGERFGDLIVKWRTGGGPWQTISTAELAEAGLIEGIPPAPGRPGSAVWGAAGGAGPRIATRLEFREKGLTWTISLGNPTAEPIEIGGLAFPCPMSTDYVWDREVTYHQRVIRHASISGQGSWIYWMRCDATPPLLLLTPLLGTGLEYFDAVPRKGIASRPYTVYIHSAAEKEVLAEKGTRWRQAATSVVLAPHGTPGDSASYGFRFSWADSIEDARRRLVEDGLVDVQAMPGMTVPLDLQARIALRSREPIRSVEAEFPRETELRQLDSTRPGVSIWSLRFRHLGENLLTLRWGEGRAMVLEFFVAEPLETLVRKRARFLARSQHRDPSKWYDGLITDWNLRDRVLLSPDALSTVPESRRYMVTCDDPGLGKPAFLAAKNAEFPEAAEIEALERYIGRFLWGGLQRTDAEHHPFGIYGIPDWKRNRESADEGTKGKLHIWRI